MLRLCRSARWIAESRPSLATSTLRICRSAESKSKSQSRSFAAVVSPVPKAKVRFAHLFITCHFTGRLHPTVLTHTIYIISGPNTARQPHNAPQWRSGRLRGPTRCLLGCWRLHRRRVSLRERIPPRREPHHGPASLQVDINAERRRHAGDGREARR